MALPPPFIAHQPLNGGLNNNRWTTPEPSGPSDVNQFVGKDIHVAIAKLGYPGKEETIAGDHIWEGPRQNDVQGRRRGVSRRILSSEYQPAWRLSCGVSGAASRYSASFS
jgi:hypothetical protein